MVDWRYPMWAVPNSLTLPICYESFQAVQAPEARENDQTKRAAAGKSREHSNSFWLSCLSYVDGVATLSDFKTIGNIGFSILLQMLYTQMAFSKPHPLSEICLFLLASLYYFLPVTHCFLPCLRKALNTKVKIHWLLPFFYLSSLLSSILSCQYLLW